MKFQKGQSGNPNGRPKSEQAVTPTLRRLLADKQHGKTRAENVANTLLTLAESGDVSAIRIVLERVDGKVADQVELGGEAKFRVTVNFDGADRD